jgi:hypothetical protein
MLHRSSNLDGFFETTEIWTWNTLCLLMAGSLSTVARELVIYKLDLVRVLEIKWDRSGNEPACNYTYFYGNGNHDSESIFFVPKESVTECRI